MKNFRNIYFLQIVAGMLLLASCSNEEYLGGHYTTDGAGVATTITATAPDGETWAAGTRVGISTGYATYDASARNREYVSESGGNGSGVNGYYISDGLYTYTDLKNRIEDMIVRE